MSAPIYAKAIFFDAVGTLFRVRGTVGQVYWETARPYGVRASPDEIQAAFNEVFSQAPSLAFTRLQAHFLRRSEKQWWRRVVQDVFKRVGMVRNFEAFFDELFRAFAGLRGWELYPETRDVLRKLKKEGYILGIISNFDSRILTVCTDLEIFQYLDSVQISSRTGFAKPNPKIFQKAIKHHGLAPGEAVHVGDDLAEDVAGAQAAGIQPIHLVRNPVQPPLEGVSTVRSLEGLFPLLRLL